MEPVPPHILKAYGLWSQGQELSHRSPCRGDTEFTPKYLVFTASCETMTSNMENEFAKGDSIYCSELTAVPLPTLHHPWQFWHFFLHPFTVKKSLQRKYFVMQKRCEIQVSVCTNKTSLEQVTLMHLHIILTFLMTILGLAIGFHPVNPTSRT